MIQINIRSVHVIEYRCSRHRWYYRVCFHLLALAFGLCTLINIWVPCECINRFTGWGISAAVRKPWKRLLCVKNINKWQRKQNANTFNSAQNVIYNCLFPCGTRVNRFFSFACIAQYRHLSEEFWQFYRKKFIFNITLFLESASLDIFYEIQFHFYSESLKLNCLLTLLLLLVIYFVKPKPTT